CQLSDCGIAGDYKIVVLNRMAQAAGPSSSTRRPLAGAGRRTKKSEIQRTSTTARTGIHGVRSEGLGTAAAGSGRLKAAALASIDGATFNGSASFFIGRECISRGPRASESPGRLGSTGGASAAGGPVCGGESWAGGGGCAALGVTFFALVSAGRGCALTVGGVGGAARPAP